MLYNIVSLQRGFFIIVLDLRLTKLIRGCRETAFNCLRGIDLLNIEYDCPFYFIC